MRQAALDQAVAMIAPKTNASKVETAGNSEDEEPSGREARSRFVFDEGHHIFDAADGAFSTHLSAVETAELRRWIRGAEGARGRRGRGLEDRIGDLVNGDTVSEEALAAAISAAAALPSAGWGARLNDGQPRREGEEFLAHVSAQVRARAQDDDTPFSLEAETEPLVEGLSNAARAFDQALGKLGAPLLRIAEGLRAKLDKQSEDLDSATRTRMDAAARGLERRAKLLIPSWRAMLSALGQPTPEHFVDWFAIERIAGRDFDVGMHRHWCDPSEPFAESVLEPAHGVVITSATLRDRLPDDAADDEGWQSAEIRTGVTHLATPARRAFMLSPFDYAAQSRIYVVRDVKAGDVSQIAAAYRELFLAAGGGGLGLFTAIHRLRAVHERIIAPLEQAGLTLYGQHVDALDTSTLVDIFRAEKNACLLGTDAVRDGVDVPGASLRMIVFDRTPWPRPDILHKARSGSNKRSGALSAASRIAVSLSCLIHACPRASHRLSRPASKSNASGWPKPLQAQGPFSMPPLLTRRPPPKVRPFDQEKIPRKSHVNDCARKCPYLCDGHHERCGQRHERQRIAHHRRHRETPARVQTFRSRASHSGGA